MLHEYKSGRLELFGLYYLHLFKRKTTQSTRLPNDESLKKEVTSLQIVGILLSGIIGVVCVFPMVWFDIQYQHSPWYIHYSINLFTILFFTIIEFYLLFVLSLRCVHHLGVKVNIHANEKDYLRSGAFSITNILARAALEINEPEISLFGINPFRQVSKRNLLMLGILYKVKIILSNVVLKYGLLFFVGKEIGGVSVFYEALFVEFFWNAVVIHKVILESRLRIFGFILANQVCALMEEQKFVDNLSQSCKMTCLRAIGNTIVFTKNYHPNMVILLLECKELLQIKEPKNLDNWGLFIQDLHALKADEQNFVRDLLCISAAFDGKISNLETTVLQEAFDEYDAVYFMRLKKLQQHIIHGELEAAKQLCGLDFIAG
jgi:hypothetical protein